MIWAVQNKIYGTQLGYTGYPSTILFLVAVLNFIGYVWNMPAIFTWTAAMFWAVAPALFGGANNDRLLLASWIPSPFTDTAHSWVQTEEAGYVILFFGSIVSFGCAPMQAPAFALGLDIILLIAVAVFDIIGGALIGNLGAESAKYLGGAGVYVIYSSEVFIVLVFFAYAILMQSKALVNASLILSAIMWCTFLPIAYQPTAQATWSPSSTGTPATADDSDKQTAGFTLAWIGLTLTVLFSVFLLSTKYADEEPEAEVKNPHQEV